MNGCLLGGVFGGRVSGKANGLCDDVLGFGVVVKANLVAGVTGFVGVLKSVPLTGSVPDCLKPSRGLEASLEGPLGGNGAPVSGVWGSVPLLLLGEASPSGPTVMAFCSSSPSVLPGTSPM